MSRVCVVCAHTKTQGRGGEAGRYNRSAFFSLALSSALVAPCKNTTLWGGRGGEGSPIAGMPHPRSIRPSLPLPLFLQSVCFLLVFSVSSIPHHHTNPRPPLIIITHTYTRHRPSPPCVPGWLAGWLAGGLAPPSFIHPPPLVIPSPSPSRTQGPLAPRGRRLYARRGRGVAAVGRADGHGADGLGLEGLLLLRHGLGVAPRPINAEDVSEGALGWWGVP